jgi:hypothetical protein
MPGAKVAACGGIIDAGADARQASVAVNFDEKYLQGVHTVARCLPANFALELMWNKFDFRDLHVCQKIELLGASGEKVTLRSFDPLHAQMRLVKHLDHDAVGVRAVKRRAAVAVRFERVNDAHPLGNKLLFQFFYSLGAFDDEAQVIQLLFFRGRREICRDTVDRNVVAA